MHACGYMWLYVRTTEILVASRRRWNTLFVRLLRPNRDINAPQVPLRQETTLRTRTLRRLAHSTHQGVESLSLSLSLSLSVSLSVCMCLCLAVSLSVCLSLCLSVCLAFSVCLSLSIVTITRVRRSKIFCCTNLANR